MFHSLVIAFAMYSKIPMPRVDWNEKNMKYVMACFPWVGIAIGVLQIGCFLLLDRLQVGAFFRGVVLAVLPILVTGGIHMDGFMDTMDARGSWGDMEKKLAILKDSHTGAFAILGCVVYFACSAAVWSEIPLRGVIALAFGFFLARCLSGFSVTTFRCARNSGLAHTFHSAAQKQTVKMFLLVQGLLCIVALALVDWVLAIPMVVTAALVFAYYRYFSYRDFGGITGDLAGYFLQLCELFMALSVMVVLHLI